MKLIRFTLWLILMLVATVYTILIVIPFTAVATIIFYRANPSRMSKAVVEQKNTGHSEFTDMISMIFSVDTIDCILNNLKWW